MAQCVYKEWIMAKKIDTNGYWYIKHNPISKEGVFPYLGQSISDECEPNKIYKVYRPASTLKESVETWDNPPKPFIDDHEMLGEGFTAIDERPVQGIIYNPSFDNGVLYADIAVYSEDLKQNIENGKKELSLGYFCKYKKERGVFKGEVYDYVQYDMVGNHIALVDAGRCGSDVKVFDHKCTMDSLDLGGFETPLKKTSEDGIIESKETKGSNMSYVAMDDVRSVLAGVFDAADPKMKSILDELEEKAKTEDEDEKEEEKKSEDSDEKENEKKTEDKCGKDSDDDEKKESEDEDDDDKKETQDSMKELMSVVKDMALDIKKLVAKDEDDEEKKESEDGDDSDDESKEKKTEDEDEDDETKKSEDSAVFVFGQDSAIAEDEGLKEYLK